MNTWRLDNIYSFDEEFQKEVEHVRELLKPSQDQKQTILNVQEAGKLVRQLEAYVDCLLAQNTVDQIAHQKSGCISELLASYEGALFALGNQLASVADFQALLKELPDIAFYIEEMRSWAKEKAPVEQEKLINALSADGYHSFWSLYQSYTGKIKVGEEGLSIGQAFNALTAPDRDTRLKAFQDWEEAWKGSSDFLAQMLNHIAGFRLKVYAARGWDDILHEPLFLNRMEPETMDAMWTAIEKAKPAFLKYLKKKAEILGLEKLSWIDVEAPIGKPKEVSWEEACQTVIEQFNKFHPKMGAFAKNAFESQWVEAEDRPGKAAGGFCVMLPKTGESRIFMTFKGTANNVATLAHELGHAYHNERVKHLPFFHQLAQMNVAETASTFGELVVIDQAIQSAKSLEEKLQLLDDKLQRSVAFFMNLHARLLFEKAFYAERKKGFVSADKLCELMTEAQKNAYCDALSDWDPYFWASKLHFYYTHFPFYNFPYTFGYLMSNGLYAHAKGEGFGEKLDAFLEDTAQMRVEDLAKKHLGVDLTKPEFWEESLAALTQDIEEFITLS
ncbi:MAG: M3 family oligoendopeptidase [Simkaniaceae bacterium]|nr:M3 family oligoendopeptidase [Candidatus Sacchlamyda saccharinae]